MKANAERIEKNTVILEIEVDADQFSRAIDSAYRKLVKKVNVPGFRKGKTPRQILERFIGKEAIYEEAMDTLVPEAYFKAVEDTGIEPIDQPKMELVQVEEGKPVVLKATVQVKPEVQLGQYKELELARPSTLVTDEEVQESLVKLRDRHAKLLTLEEGVVENGDTAVIDFLGKVDGEPFSGGEGREYPLEIGTGSFIAGFEEQTVGMSSGETRDIEVTFPEDYKAEELAGKKATFTVTVKEIKRKELAELDDEFAKDVSEFDTLEELRNDISNKLKEAAESRADGLVRMELVRRAVENSIIEVPEAMIDHQLEDLMGTMERRLSAQGVSVQDYLKYANITLEDMQDQMRPEAEQTVRTNLVLEAISKTEDIKASEEEIKEQAEKIAAQFNQDADKFISMLRDEKRLGYITEGIIRDKTVQLMVDSAIFTDDTNEKTEE